MRFTMILVALALAVPMASNAQSKRTTKKTTTTTTESSAPAAAASAAEPTAQPARKQRESLHDQFTGQGYGLAGCGLGSVVFGPKTGMIQIVAATLNGTGGNQTFGITTGTSNCDIPGMGHQAAAFIEVNREIVSKDAARGQGETIASLASILNCQDETAFGQNLQQNYESIFATENNSYDVTRKILSTIEANPTLKSTCNIDG